MKKISKSIQKFGEHFAELRKAKGFTQQALADKIGATQRIINYYENESRFPPSHYIVDIARALDVSVEELLIFKTVEPSPQNKTLLKKMRSVEQFLKSDQKKVFDLIHLILEKNRAKQAAS